MSRGGRYFDCLDTSAISVNVCRTFCFSTSLLSSAHWQPQVVILPTLLHEAFPSSESPEIAIFRPQNVVLLTVYRRHFPTPGVQTTLTPQKVVSFVSIHLESGVFWHLKNHFISFPPPDVRSTLTPQNVVLVVYLLLQESDVLWHRKTSFTYCLQEALPSSKTPDGEVWSTYSNISGLMYGIIFVPELRGQYNITPSKAGFDTVCYFPAVDCVTS